MRADCKEDIGVGPTNGHKGDKLTPATIFGCMKLGLETSAAERDGRISLFFFCHFFVISFSERPHCILQSLTSDRQEEVKERKNSNSIDFFLFFPGHAGRAPGYSDTSGQRRRLLFVY